MIVGRWLVGWWVGFCGGDDSGCDLILLYDLQSIEASELRRPNGGGEMTQLTVVVVCLVSNIRQIRSSPTPLQNRRRRRSTRQEQNSVAGVDYSAHQCSAYVVRHIQVPLVLSCAPHLLGPLFGRNVRFAQIGPVRACVLE